MANIRIIRNFKLAGDILGEALPPIDSVFVFSDQNTVTFGPV